MEVFAIMKAKEQIIQELNRLSRIEILKLYSLISALKGDTLPKEKAKPSMRFNTAYLKARKALKNCKGSLAEDIISDREERI